jgi:four helix bundle protein
MHFTNTRIHTRCIELLRETHATIQTLPSGYGYLADQLRRAAASILLNFAEGCGKPSVADRNRYFAASRGSAYEVAAVYDILLAFGLCDNNKHLKVIDQCDHLAAMLTRFTGHRYAGNRKP